jgi:peptidoglycan hydrolase-like protein with peptidoglycan-binding domain
VKILSFHRYDHSASIGASVGDVSDWVPSSEDLISADDMLMGTDATDLDGWTPDLSAATDATTTDSTTADSTRDISKESVSSPTDSPLVTAKKATGITPPSPSGIAVLKSIQTKLLSLGYSVGKTGVDGKMGPATAGAITSFKKDRSIFPANGIVTPAFRSALAAATPIRVSAPTSSIASAWTELTLGTKVVTCAALAAMAGIAWHMFKANRA